MTGDTVTHRKVFSCALLTLLLLTLPIHSQGQFCPGERVSSFSCTTELNHAWAGSALAGQCPSSNPVTNDMITITTAFNEGDTVPCGIFAANITNIIMMMGGNSQLSSTISFTANSSLNGTEVVCTDGNQAEVESYPITIIGPPTAPDITMVNFTPRVAFIIMWDGTAVVSTSAVTGFQVDTPSGITCDDTSSSPSAMESRCSWEPSAVGQTHSVCVSTINCGSQQGASDCVNVTLQVPVAPTLTACPVYDQSGPFLRIESNCTTVPAVVIADGVDGSPDAYIFSYNDGDDSVIPSGQCTGGTCTDEFTPDPAVSQYTVSVTARNVVGEGPPDTARPITTTNNFVTVTIDLTNEDMEVTCTFLSGFTGTAECQIEYSTQEDLSSSVVGMGNSTSGDTVTVDLPPLNEVTYHYIVTATADGVTVRVQGFFRTNCLASELGEEDATMNQNCPESSNGSVQISAVRACYSGLVPGATAEYACNCAQYRMEGTGNRTCQNNGSWSGTVPQCRPELYASVLGIMGASFYGSILGNIFYLIISFLCYRPKQTWLIPFIIIVSIPLPLVGLAWSWWLVRERVPVVSSIDKDKSFVRKWWRAIVIAIGVFLYLLYLAIFIALAVIFAPPNVLPCDGDFDLLFFGFAIATITFLFWIVAVNLLCCLPRPVPEGADEADYCKPKKKKTGDVEMTTAAEYGKLEHGITTPPAIADPTDPLYSHLAGDKAGEASAEEYSQLQRQKAPKGVPNIGDPSYSHLQGGAGQQEYNELQHGKPPTVPPHVVEDYSQLKRDAPLVYSEVSQDPRWQLGGSKKKSSTDL